MTDFIISIIIIICNRKSKRFTVFSLIEFNLELMGFIATIIIEIILKNFCLKFQYYFAAYLEFKQYLDQIIKLVFVNYYYLISIIFQIYYFFFPNVVDSISDLAWLDQIISQ